ncbi:hypothetical protein C5B85_10830 [Pseudoclavibacter sp. AY1F1]|uniref:hypothetical protein n=1 Tax=Pseudoclavibacter sp. AY1F1 TaxID=2080583 RepID=UPI000CE8BE23|nr:hypothetical protein [Pseudoclavibacter sp. AY1F1]PPF44132.1 hypothetical protein C5B85_10830 [Pseudoclavibacter sp. AY1F1]
MRAKERASEALDVAEKLENWQPISAAALAAQARMVRLTDAADCDASVLAQEAEVDELEADLLALDGLIEEQRGTGQQEPTWASTLGDKATDALLWLAASDGGKNPTSPPPSALGARGAAVAGAVAQRRQARGVEAVVDQSFDGLADILGGLLAVLTLGLLSEAE